MIRLLSLLLLLLLPLRATAQEQSAALLVADELYITRERDLVASGNVEAFQNGIRLSASSIRYNQNGGGLKIEGPITLTEGEDTVIVANSAELDADLRNGILKGARLVLKQQLQLAAVQIDRVDGRYSQLYKTAVTSCRICDDGRPPLWQIRAKRVIHDEVEQQLYFDEAQFRIGRIPVLWLPRLRMPGPTVERASGFLVPSIRSTSSLGVGVKIPYFFKLSEKRDLTLTPYLSSSTTTLEFRYRQSYRNGRIQFDGAITRDDLRPSETRGYVFGNGLFALPNDFVLNFAIETVSDDGYLDTYGYSSKDRLRTELTISRARRDEYIRASFYNFKSIRDDEENETLPTLVLDGEYERRFFPTSLGGELRTRFEAHSHGRISDLAVDSDDADDVVDGRDVTRLSAEIDWLRSFTLRNGLRTDTTVGLAFHTFNISQDDTTAADPSEITPHAAVTLRYPLVKTTASGVSHVLEPVVQLSWTGGDRLDIPNEESTRVEFDQGNLLAMSHFPRADRRERGAMAAVGLGWSRFNPDGWDAQLSVGQVFREDLDTSFSTTSGLNTLSSDLLVAGQVSSKDGIILTGRGLFENDFSLSKAEFRGDYNFDRGRIGGSYVWLQEDADEDRDSEVSEFTLDGSYKINQFWTASADWRYDLASDRASTAGLGLRYENECVTLDLTVDRSYSTSTSVEPSTDFGFNIGLRGFSADTGTERYVRSCSN
ncbi:LPS-assembly protein LptD [Sulfitobacter donghicola]|uniref:LPS-assembly protein LptD n=1 Tax=Sulfitobacter donghicola DSW-25 = KCTC 12864 = JCM 14565 TaxID=1300350 RepID=A0A073IW55_9RHOB|nr:LPS assembly protein LptD [Sulfitobacter donghicola]KEJ89592.1 organic solvent tolerance protein [Sulfitobacter donghicola DSW-25 = KCTC 12864 = JCM 14565]KIN69429.1 Organic solvent tolerance protein [Sulfitobacter donghicola DSW-25 = KCTC 12864 = JCM 14565]